MYTVSQHKAWETTKKICEKERTSHRRKMVEKFRNKKEIPPPGEFSMKNFLVENGDVAMTLEKFSRARERGTL